MSVGGFFRSLSQKVSQSLEEIKVKSSEATNDIARGMREIRDTTKAGVEKLGEVLQISDTDTTSLQEIDEAAGMALIAHYSQALGSIKSNNRSLIEKGDRVAEEMQKVQKRTAVQHESINAIIKQCEKLPDLCASVDTIHNRCGNVIQRLAELEAKLGEAWEDQVVSQISVWKKERESELEAYRKSKNAELTRIEAELVKSRDSKLAEKRIKALAKEAEMEHAVAAADSALRERLNESIKKEMDDYLIYGFTARSAPAVPTEGAGPSSSSPSATDSALALASVTLPVNDNPGLDDFLGQEDVPAYTQKQEEEDESGPSVRVDDTTIDSPEL